MTESEAIEKLEAHIECESKRSSIEGCNEGCIDCELAYLQGTSKEHIESVKLAIQALEKQIPKKPRKTDSYRGVLKRIYAYVCPTCGNVCLEKYMNERQNTTFCWDCGQRLDWSGENDD